MPTHPHGVRLRIAYDGTRFSGWQLQPGVRTVQGVVEEAIDALGMKRSRVRGTSRTDAGVHAEGQFAAFSTDQEIPPRGWVMALNGLLPDDVSIRDAAPCDPRYDPRFDAVQKRYHYVCGVGLGRNPLINRYAWHLGPKYARKDLRGRLRGERAEDYLDIPAMHDAAARLQGTHDFRAFRAADDPRETTERTLFEVNVRTGHRERPELLVVEVVGDAFMKNMVRILAGTLLEIGRQAFSPERIDRLLGEEARRQDAGPTAPAHGLTLDRIWLGRGDWGKGPKPAREDVLAQEDSE